MKVAVDKHIYTRSPNSGMGVYIQKVVRALEKDKNISVVLLDYRGRKEDSLWNKVYNLLYEQFAISWKYTREVTKKRVGVFFSPNPPVPIFLNRPIVLTIPDLSFYYDQSMNKIIKAYLFFVYFLSARKAKLITTFSESSRKDIVRILRVAPNKVEVTPLGVRKISSKLNSREVLKKFGIGKRYILSVPGTFIPRKNMIDLVKAYKNLDEKIREKYLLVLVGNNKDNYYENFAKIVKKSKLTKNVVFTGYVSEGELVALYKGAVVFAFPSLHEGFGLPPLEAMSLGTPTIVYNRSSLPEVVGDASILVNNSKELRSALVETIKKSDLRRSLSVRGLKQSRKFSWNKATKNIINIIKSGNE
ncbi:hypothetical protein A2803_03875 [Candidatus Woesebacteria bacterium RIFCSPHIGHO2_01_FULL_44_21]|uniref:Uncharacterized protein n=1 Tax=Candidatus Woesebacteria bacterium RIFCSPHIGHO2_01_FULL_44_21 TaxID=1802503 RepID=A0A1F7YVW1_9BACT|nr:MAG: hypothetical protein A2803_03875 [Candidatus Woesebacteria bacterium RIFCSPHIGHO2_01_FULL_44_21]